MLKICRIKTIEKKSNFSKHVILIKYHLNYDKNFIITHILENLRKLGQSKWTFQIYTFTIFDNFEKKIMHIQKYLTLNCTNFFNFVMHEWVRKINARKKNFIQFYPIQFPSFWLTK